jgi:16S rRNA (cytidine1402-2'-O)-methyltransferase
LVEEIAVTGRSFGLLSEAGLPCIADPGHQVVDHARAQGYDIVPLTGPSSIFMALMASGLNGQEFTFHGYLPIKEPALTKKLKYIQDQVTKTGYTQLFIETPYRNIKLYEKMLSTLQDQTKLCIAQDISSAEEWIDTKSVKAWKTQAKVDLKKAPCIFLIGK